MTDSRSRRLFGSPQPSFRLVKGREAVLSFEGVLGDFAELCEQAGAMQDMTYFLSKPGVLQRTPQLMLIFKGAPVAGEQITAADLAGALLLYEYQVTGCGLGIFTTNDRSGRSTVIAPPGSRSSVAEFAARTLVNRGAHVVMISYRNGVSAVKASLALTAKRTARAASSQWARREREIPEYLALEATYDATLAKIGQRTRSNMRYSRRRAEKDLGCTFCESVTISEEQFLAFNTECMYAVSNKVAAWRFRVHRELSTPLLMGIRDRDGRWLSLVGGRRLNGSSEILWQMNRDGLPLYSLSLVMRSFFMEHEISKGSRRFYIEGGSPHPIRHSFVNETVIDLAVLRRSPAALLTRKLARHVISEDNELAGMFFDPTLDWQTLGDPPALATSIFAGS